MKHFSMFLATSAVIVACACGKPAEKKQKDVSIPDALKTIGDIKALAAIYEEVDLAPDTAGLSEEDKQVLALLVKAARVMDDLFWQQAFGEKKELLSRTDDPVLKKYLLINYGPWDRLNNNQPFVEGFGDKPAGAQFYPTDMTREEYESANIPGKESPYTTIRRNSKGELQVVPFHIVWKTELEKAAGFLREASKITNNQGLKKYLSLRADALLTDDYRKSDIAWLQMKDNVLDIVIGPIENYEDALLGQKNAYEAYVLVKDVAWSKKLEKFASYLPQLQANMPVEQRYKKEKPGSDADLNAYDVVLFAGDCNAGGKTIAINLPNDEDIQLQYGTRKLQLKNAMRAKFEKIMQPISDILVIPAQRKHVNFDAFFANTMFHEVAHGLGIKYTINGKGKVKDVLKEHSAALEEGKADILGLYMITQLHALNEIEGDLMDYYVTFMAGIFRSVRFGAASAHGKANMIRFNYFMEKGAISRNDDGTYQVHFEKMQEAMQSLTALILKLQGDGDYAGVEKLVKEKGNISETLQKDLDKLGKAGIPVDIVWKNGMEDYFLSGKQQ